MNASELNFAYKVRHALNENLDNLPASSVSKLASARNVALSRKKPNGLVRAAVTTTAWAGQVGHFFNEPMSLLGRLGIAAPLLAGLIVFVGLYQFEQQQRISEMAEIDVAVLSDDLPLTAYLDNGFSAYLSKQGE